MSQSHRRGFSLVGLLVVVVCIFVLMTIMLTSTNKRVTGDGSAVEGSLFSTQDKMVFYAINQSLALNAMENEGRYLVPSELTGSLDPAENRTANLFSALIMKRYVIPKQLISANEYSPFVEEDTDYDFRAYQPRLGQQWDPGFVADLDKVSNVSFAHMPLHGERLRQFWRSGGAANVAIMGNRGPRDGIDDPQSYSVGDNGQWGGHILFADGHIEFHQTFTPPGLYYDSGGRRLADNVFAIESGPDGEDSVLAFTKEMSGKGPVLQYD